MRGTLPARQLDALLPGGERDRLSVIPRPLGEGADATVHAIAGHPDFVAKLYRTPDAARRAKLEAMLAAAPNRSVTAHAGARVVELAWPEVLLTPPDADALAGFVMPSVDLSTAALLAALLSARGRDAADLTHDVRFRVAAAANLAAAVAELHALGHHVIDLKPSNLHVYRTSALVAVLDCDGMSVRGPDGERFPAHQYTDGYIAPEALRRRDRPEALGEPQDRFALAVVVFQLLGNGLHPFQGVPNRAARDVPTTNGERIAAGLYPYGSGARTLAPPPASPFAFLDTRTQTLFDRAFDASPDARPSAADWRDHLRALLADELASCPENPDHARFGDKLCAGCELDPAFQKRRRRAAFESRREKGSWDVPSWVVSPEGERTNRAIFGCLALIVALVGGGFLIGLFVLLSTGGLSVNIASDRGVSLDDAFESGSPRLVERVLTRDPSIPSAPPSRGLYGDLYDAGPDWTAPIARSARSDRFSPLHHAALIAEPGMLDVVLRSGIDVDSPDVAGRTPLMAAVTATGGPVVASEETIGRIDGEAASLLFRSDRSPAILRAAQAPDALWRGLSGKVLVVTESAVPAYAPASMAMVDDVFQRAVAVRQLVRAGASVGARDSWGRTPLHYAALSGNGPALWMLTRAGADVDAADAAGITPLMILADGAREPATDRLAAQAIRLLLLAGADASQRDRSGRTAADFVGSPGQGDELARSRARALLLDAEDGASWTLDALPAFNEDIAGVRVQPDQAADVGDPQTDYGTDESDALAARFPKPPWRTGETLRLSCGDVSPARVEAVLPLLDTETFGVARRGPLSADAWTELPPIPAAEAAADAERVEARARQIRVRERCLAQASLLLSNRFDVREETRRSGPVPVVVTARDGT